MDANTLTIVVGVLGVVASAVVSAVAYRAGARSSRKEMQALSEQLQDVRLVLKNVLDGVRSGTPRAIPRRPGQSEVTVVETSVDEAGELLVRATLAALVNEHGEVQIPRLVKDLGSSSDLHWPDISSILVRLRAANIVTWEGPDDSLSGVSTVSLHR